MKKREEYGSNNKREEYGGAKKRDEYSSSKDRYPKKTDDWKSRGGEDIESRPRRNKYMDRSSSRDSGSYQKDDGRKDRWDDKRTSSRESSSYTTERPKSPRYSTEKTGGSSSGEGLLDKRLKQVDDSKLQRFMFKDSKEQKG